MFSPTYSVLLLSLANGRRKINFGFLQLMIHFFSFFSQPKLSRKYFNVIGKSLYTTARLVDQLLSEQFIDCNNLAYMKIDVARIKMMVWPKPQTQSQLQDVVQAMVVRYVKLFIDNVITWNTSTSMQEPTQLKWGCRNLVGSGRGGASSNRPRYQQVRPTQVIVQWHQMEPKMSSMVTCD